MSHYILYKQTVDGWWYVIHPDDIEADLSYCKIDISEFSKELRLIYESVRLIHA